VHAGHNAVPTAIFKEPVSGRVLLRTENLDGDRQADLTVHGGVDKAVYLYASEHYPFWSEQLGILDLSWGAFGENLTTTGLDESNVHIGDRFTIGSAEFVVRQPRTPCHKLALRFGRPDLLKSFLQSGRTGFYAAVTTEGTIDTGDRIEFIERDPDAISIRAFVGLYASGDGDPELLRRVRNLASLPKHWREYFGGRVP